MYWREPAPSRNSSPKISEAIFQYWYQSMRTIFIWFLFEYESKTSDTTNIEEGETYMAHVRALIYMAI